jgi:hypothetical protein
MRPIFLACAVAAITACGSNSNSSPDAPKPIDAPAADAPIDPGSGGSGSNAGSGTGTLVVNGAVTATANTSNTSNAADFTTTFTVSIHEAAGGALVTTGNVAIGSTGGPVNLIYDSTTMTWHGSQAGYFQNYSLSIASGADSVNGVTVGGPDIHTFTTPTENATVDSTMALALAWMRTIVADNASIRTRQLNATMIPDSGSDSLGSGSLRSAPNQTTDERIDLTRTDVVTPAGAATGSRFSVSITNSVDVTVQAAP